VAEVGWMLMVPCWVLPTALTWETHWGPVREMHSVPAKGLVKGPVREPAMGKLRGLHWAMRWVPAKGPHWWARH
jgi:hypothetical protein